MQQPIMSNTLTIEEEEKKKPVPPAFDPEIPSSLLDEWLQPLSPSQQNFLLR